VKTSAIFFPFDLFGSAGTGGGVELLADEFEEMLADNRQERIATRARAYTNSVEVRQFAFENLAAYQDWRQQARQAARRVLNRNEFLLWITGNHLGVLPIYDELSAAEPRTLVVQFDAHLDIHNFGDCTREPSHGNFLLHSEGPLPAIINVGNRELLLKRGYIQKYYQQTFSADQLAIDARPALTYLREAATKADRVFLDIDCDVFDPSYFPAVSHPVPFGLSPPLFLQLLDAVWSEKLIGIAFSEFDPSRDRDDRSLATLMWLLEYLLLRRHEAMD
jgi:agmatinase